MDSEPEVDCNKSDNSVDKVCPKANGEVDTQQLNGKHLLVAAVTDDSLTTGEQVSNKCEAQESPKLDRDQEKHEVQEGDKSQVNGEEKSLGKDGKPLVQRRMSLRPRAAPKKYADAEANNSDEDVRTEPAVLVAAKDPLEIPLGRNSSTVLIRKSGPVAATVTVSKSPAKLLANPAVKMTRVTRPPPELIKAPILPKISISSSTSVTVVPRSKDNSTTSGFVVVDTQSILKGANTSVTVSAVPAAVKPQPVAVPTPPYTPVPSHPPQRKKLPSSHNASLPDPFETLGSIHFSIFLCCDKVVLTEFGCFFRFGG